MRRIPRRGCLLGAIALAVVSAFPPAARAQSTGRPPAASLPVPLGATREQVLLGDRIFHGEAAGGRCSICHGADAKGTGNGNDLTVGMWIWGDGSVKMLKATVMHNMSIAPGMDGNLTPSDVDAVVAYVWALGHQQPLP
jgi:mono/diheme cytochrome c family protein